MTLAIDPVVVSGQASQVAAISEELRSAWLGESGTLATISANAFGGMTIGSEITAQISALHSAADSAVENLSDSLEAASDAMQACAADFTKQDEVTAQKFAVS
ncbi:hypothetical protein [Schaalia suimastitidis]|uniref:hypothetical protein n=1 Tax=Schaalia suimastitidis TaxID=121163 RepID=UPI0003F910E9|nr:hypothetical protein [Schaalia suimastitidis]